MGGLKHQLLLHAMATCHMQIFDLLNARKALVSREDSRKRINIVGLREWHVEDESLVQQLIDHAAAARQTGQTGANAESSRSHAIMQFTLKKHQLDGMPGGREV
jgi:kinesin family member 2/24